MSEPTRYAPPGPLDQAPSGSYCPPRLRGEAIREALGPIELDTYDELIIDWMAESWDDSTLRTIVSLITRARQTGTEDTTAVTR